MRSVKVFATVVSLLMASSALAQSLPPGLTPEQKKAFEMMNDPAFQQKMREQQMQMMQNKEQFQQLNKLSGQTTPPAQKIDLEKQKKVSANPVLQDKLSKATPLACEGCKVTNEMLLNHDKMMANVPQNYQSMMPKVDTKYPKIMFAKIFQDAAGKSFGVTAVFPGGGVERYGQEMAIQNPMMQPYYNKENLKNIPKSDEEYEKTIKEALAFGTKSSVQGFDAYVFDDKKKQDELLKSKGGSFLKPTMPAGTQQMPEQTSTVLVLDKPDHVRIYLNYPEEKQGQRLLDYAAKMDLSVYSSVFDELRNQ